MSVSVFINACRLLSALPSLSQFGRGRLSLVPISFYVLSLLLGPCRLSEFTLAGPHVNINKKKLNFNLCHSILQLFVTYQPMRLFTVIQDLVTDLELVNFA